MDHFEKKTIDTIRDENLFRPGAKIVAALSGGPDSVAVLRALLSLSENWKLDISAAHLNHGIRGEESDEDEKWVRTLCKALGVPLKTARLDDCPESNLEAFLRDARYKFLLSAARERGAELIALGHQADDLAETVIINLLRGSGTAGLSGMLPGRKAYPPDDDLFIIRPLIRHTRDEIMMYLDSLGQNYREDPSNLDRRFFRNRVRHEVMPALVSLNPEIKNVLVRTAEVARMESEVIRGEAKKITGPSVTKDGQLFVYSADCLTDVPVGVRMGVHREIIKEVSGSLLSINLGHLRALDDLILKGPAHGTLDFPGLTVRKEYEKIYFGRPAEISAKFKNSCDEDGHVCSELPVPGCILWEGPDKIKYTICAEYVKLECEKTDNITGVLLDPQKFKGMLTVRQRIPGDRYSPVGMDGSRKLKDVMNELKIPPRKRDLWPLVADQENILWMVGFRPSKMGAPGPLASVLLKVTIDPQIAF